MKGVVALMALVAGMVACSDANPPAAADMFPSVGELRPVNLQPGAYVTSVMDPPLRLEVGDGWIHVGEFPPLLLLSRAIGARQADALNFITFPESDVDAVVTAIASEPVLGGPAIDTADLAGRTGRGFTADVTVAGGGSAEIFSFPNNELYSQVPLDPPLFNDNDRVRVTAAQIGDDVLVALVLAGAEEFESFSVEADALLETLTVG